MTQEEFLAALAKHGDIAALDKRVTPQPCISCPSYTQPVFDPYTLPMTARWAADKLDQEKIDAIVVCGHSGLVLAGALCLMTMLPIFAVRKRGEVTVNVDAPSVSGMALNGPAKRWAWVDDHICSGGTLKHAMEMLAETRLVEEYLPTALVCYDEPDYRKLFSFYTMDKAPARKMRERDTYYDQTNTYIYRPLYGRL